MKPRTARSFPARRSPRPPGRPAGADHRVLDRRVIIEMGLSLAKTVPLQDISMIRIARELGVTPALIHYYLGDRDTLTSGIMNAFYREVLQTWPAPTGEWRTDVENMARYLYTTHVKHPGIAAYAVARNRYRLAQVADSDETAYGVLVFERSIAVIRQAGFDAARTAMFAHLLIEYVISNAHATVRHRWPGEHKQFLATVFDGLDPKVFPNAYFIRESYTKLNAATAFEGGLQLLLRGLEPDKTGGRSGARNGNAR